MQNAAARRAVLVRALQIIGAQEELARRLKVRPALLYSWLAGETPIPQAVYMKAIDIVEAARITSPVPAARTSPGLR